MPARVERLRAFLPGTLFVGQIDEDQVVVGAARDQVEAARDERRRERAWRSRRSACAYFLNASVAASLQRHRDARRRVVVRAALQAGEHRLVDGARVLLPCTSACRRAARAASCAWSSRPRRRAPTGDGCAPPATSPAMCAMSATSIAPTSLRDRGEAGEVDRARNRRAAAPQQLRLLLLRASSRTSSRSTRPVSLRTPYATARKYLPVIDTLQPCVRWPPAGSAHAHDGVARLAEREVDGEVRRRARVGLHVGVLDAEQRLRAVDGQLLDLVDVLLALVVALARIALAVLVRAARCRWPRAPRAET